MRRWMAAPLVFAAAAALTLTGETPEAIAQDKPAPPVEETVRTADGVELKGLFHRSAKGDATSPVVILLYAPGADRNMTKGDWEGLANRLNVEGYHVFRFDWRGHGKSTDIKDVLKFWQNPVTGPANNKYVKGAGKKPLKNDLFVAKDLPGEALNKYYPVFVNDLAAVRAHIDQKNDLGELNSSSVYLVGAGDAAALGMLWMTAEWHRPAVHPVLIAGATYDVVPYAGVNVTTEAGETVAGAAWLSPSRPGAMSNTAVKAWVSKYSLRMRDNNPMLFLYGDKDTKAKAQSEFFFDECLVAKGNTQLGLKKLEQTFLKPVDKAGTLNGVALLGNNAMLQTEDTIVKFLAAIQKERAKITRKPRNYANPYYIDLRYFGVAP